MDTGAALPMLSYRARRAAAIRVSWARIPSSAAGNSGVSPRITRLPPEGPARQHQKQDRSHRGLRQQGRGEAAGRAARAAAPQNASAAQIRLPLLRLPARRPARP